MQATALQPEHCVEPDREAGPIGDCLHREQHAGHERAAVVRVVADGERLTGGAEQHLLVRDEPAQPHRVHVDVAWADDRRVRRA